MVVLIILPCLVNVFLVVIAYLFSLFFRNMQHFLLGYADPATSSEQFQLRLQEMLPIIANETAASVKQTIIALVGKEKTDDGVLQRWPYAVSRVLRHRYMCPIGRHLWAAFCYHNDIPFGIMLAYPHLRGMLRNEAAYMDLMNSWCVGVRDRLLSEEDYRLKEKHTL